MFGRAKRGVRFRGVRTSPRGVTVQVSRSPTFQALSGASAPGAGPRIVPKYLTRSWEDVSRPWKCLGSRRLRRGERLPRGLVVSAADKAARGQKPERLAS